MNNFEIISVETAIDLQKNGVVRFYQDVEKYHYSVIKILKNHIVLLYPSVGRLIMKFNSLKDLECYFEVNKDIPVKWPGNYFADNQQVLKNWGDNILELSIQLTELLNEEYHITLNKAYLKKISKKCKEYLKNNNYIDADHTLTLLVSAFCCSIICNYHPNHEWQYKKEYWINPYCSPYLLIDGKQIYIFDEVEKQIMKKRLDILTCINLSLPEAKQLSYT